MGSYSSPTNKIVTIARQHHLERYIGHCKSAVTPSLIRGYHKYSSVSDFCHSIRVHQCPVSLVGQWINEAKSKLDDPGLVYAYHGQNRTRDPPELSQNAIVVTTYSILGSDATYHKGKSSDADYCPPLEQIRWWRVICDEGHLLKNNNDRTPAVLRLLADHKWIVSGKQLRQGLR